MVAKVNAPPVEREASGSPLEGGAKTINSTIQIRNTKWFDELTTLSPVERQIRMTKIPMTKTVKPLRHSTLQCGLIRCYYQDLCLCFPCFKHLNIRILYLFRPILYDGRYLHFVFPRL